MPPALRLVEIEHLSAYAEDRRTVFVAFAGIELPDAAGRVRAREVYETQPLIQAARQLPAWKEIWRGPVDYIDHMAMEREDYISLAIAQSDRRADILTPDGWWAGWHDGPVHALCESTETCTHTAPFSQQPEPDELTRYLEQLPDDTILVHVRAHG